MTSNVIQKTILGSSALQCSECYFYYYYYFSLNDFNLEEWNLFKCCLGIVLSVKTNEWLILHSCFSAASKSFLSLFATSQNAPEKLRQKDAQLPTMKHFQFHWWIQPSKSCEILVKLQLFITNDCKNAFIHSFHLLLKLLFLFYSSKIQSTWIISKLN